MHRSVYTRQLHLGRSLPRSHALLSPYIRIYLHIGIPTDAELVTYTFCTRVVSTCTHASLEILQRPDGACSRLRMCACERSVLAPSCCCCISPASSTCTVPHPSMHPVRKTYTHQRTVKCASVRRKFQRSSAYMCTASVYRQMRNTAAYKH